MPKIKKRYWWLLGTFSLLFVLVRCESMKMRYETEAVMDGLDTMGVSNAHFRTVDMDGTTVNYLEVGDDISKPTVVFLHGSPGSLSAYAPYYTDSILLSVCNMISLDRLGFGYSDFGDAEPSLAMQAGALAQVLGEKQRSKVILVGHSMGGPVIARAAMDYPQTIAGIIMVAPAVSPDLEPSNTWRRAVDLPPLRWLTPPALRVCNQEIIPLKAELEAMREYWPAMPMPITVVQGTEDQLVPAGNAEFVRVAVGNDSLVKLSYVEGGDHFILWSEVPLIRKEILEMIGKVGKVDF
jgi:pimeloyl-ACP methyl ester carboxylesterase